MRISLLALAIGASLAVTACNEEPQGSTATSTPAASASAQDTASGSQLAADNPFAKPSTLDFHAPAFDKIDIDDFMPAFKAGMAQHSQEIIDIANNKAEPTFDNTIVAMEKSGSLLTRVSQTFFNLSSSDGNKEMRELKSKIAPMLSQHEDDITLNPTLFKRIKAIYDARADLKNDEAKRLTEVYYKRFVRAGAQLSEQDKAAIRKLNTQESKLTTQFYDNVLGGFEKNSVVVKDKSRLKGLSDSKIASLAAAAKDKGLAQGSYLITIVNTTRQPIIANIEDRSLRQQIWEASAHRNTQGEYDNRGIVAELVQLRAKKAKLLGFDSWADYVLDNQMAKQPQAVYTMLDDIAATAYQKAQQEADDIQAAIKADDQSFTLQPWDWSYYAAKVRKSKYDLDESQLKPYFEINNVLENGLFFAMHKLYGISFKERNDLPVYEPDVRVFEVTDSNGETIGLFYADLYARTGKKGGAWMSSYVTQSGLLGNKPVIVNNLNIVKPAPGEPTLLTYDEVETMFHEFGHALHGLFSDVKYPTLAGTSVPRDNVEFPSQFNEDWSIKPEVLANYAKHYQTGEPIPEALLDKMLASHHFNTGFDTLEYLEAALLDMEWHSLSVEAAQDIKAADVEQFEKKALEKHNVYMPIIPPRYKSPYFSHTFSGGYSAGYYAYLWTEVLAADAFAYMQQNGGLTRANGDAFRSKILSKGFTADPMQLYINFRGQKPTVDALLERRGLSHSSAE